MSGNVVALDRVRGPAARAAVDRVFGVVAALGVLKPVDLAEFRDKLSVGLGPAFIECQEWPGPGGFSMFSCNEVLHYQRLIRALPAKDRPNLVLRVFLVVGVSLVPGEGRVRLSREQIAREVGCSVSRVSAAMSVLVRLGALDRPVRVREPGVSGPGRAVYFINAEAVWNGSRESRAEFAAAQRQRRLELVPP